ncbi:SCO6880 family protein [Streptomyces sp. Wb2n-11]|uniref:SCO6880 family protein n=1 Tax=Streptomyces sp. Wb2n-11 TaxID=1030533 RepID=UPI000AE8CFE0|nr:SCO6880 family protein [Streptomyces sp. Wb2n-11]
MAANEVAGGPAPRTYGNWRKPQTAGIGQLGLAPTLLMLGGLVVVVLSMLISIMLALVLAVVLALVLAPLTIKDRYGRSLLTRMSTHLAWRRAVKKGSTLYRSGPLGRTGHGTCTLPGLAASSVLTEAQDSYGRPFAMLTYPRSNFHVVVLRCDADGAALVDQDQVDVWVAYWGQWLSALSTEPGLVGASVTVETAPDSGLRLQHEVNSQLAPDAPELARTMLQEVLAEYPASSAQISTRIALTYSGAARPGHPRRSVDDMAVLLGNRLPGLTSGLGMTGAGAARPLAAEELAEAVRTAYDPAVAPLIEEARASGGSGLTWSDAGPQGAQEEWDCYRHDSAWSSTWSMSEAPRGEVLSSVLTGLLVPHPDIARKRVTILYRPHDPAAAARIVERDRKDASFRAKQTPGGRARDDVALRAAEQSAQEEASGAGLVRFGLLVTATVNAREDLPRARAAVDTLAPPARINLRPVWGSQAAAFAAGLPIGLVLPLHLAVPASIRDNM